MTTINRYDLVVENMLHLVPELRKRAEKCGLKVCDILDVQIDGEHCKKLLLKGTRWSYIKYMIVSMVKDGVEPGAMPGLIKLMFMR